MGEARRRKLGQEQAAILNRAVEGGAFDGLRGNQVRARAEEILGLPPPRCFFRWWRMAHMRLAFGPREAFEPVSLLHDLDDR